MIRKNFRFYGRVQGVGFRHTALNAASRLGLTGWVRNERDGSVSMEAQGFDVAAQKTYAVLKGDSGRLRLQVWNMGDSAKTGHVEVVGAKLKGLPEKIVLGPRGTPPAAFDCSLVPDEASDYKQKLEVFGVFGGKRSSRLSMSVRLEKQFLASCEAVPLDWRNLKGWERNTSAESYKASWDEAEQALRFDVAWTNPHTDRWFYPVYRLKLPKEGFAGAQLFQFEVKSAQDKVENDFATQNLMLLFADKVKNDRFIAYQAPLGSWEKRYVELGDIDSLDDVTAFRLGANPKGMKCTFWIRGLELLKAKHR